METNNNINTTEQERIEQEKKANERREQALKDVKLYLASDWNLIEETPEFFLLKRRTDSLGKHFVLLIFTWWTFGVANLVYYLASEKKTKIVK